LGVEEPVDEEIEADVPPVTGDASMDISLPPR
jgi:hypothetical protein